MMPLHRLIYTSPSSIRGDNNETIPPYTPFLASSRWLRRHVGVAHRLPTVEEYRDQVLGCRVAQLASMVSQRGLTSGPTRDEMVRALLAGIVTLPDALPAPGEPFEDTEIYDGTPDWDRAAAQDVRAEAKRRGIAIDGIHTEDLRELLKNPASAVVADEVKTALTEETRADAPSAQGVPTGSVADDGSWREPLKVALDSSDYVEVARVLKAHGLPAAENRSKKTVLAHAAALLEG
jgi:hypothetical protein